MPPGVDVGYRARKTMTEVTRGSVLPGRVPKLGRGKTALLVVLVLLLLILAWIDGGERSMRQAVATLPEGRKIDYINAHGTSTPVGDVTEVEAVRRVFGKGSTPPMASTKSLTGHSLGATGVHEAIYSLIMMEKGFIAASANVKELDPAIEPEEIVTQLRDGVELDSVLSNSFGFGGTNATLVMSKFKG